MSVEHLSAAELSELATYLSAIEDWLSEKCSARHSGDMADGVHRAWSIIDDLYDEAYERENRADNKTLCQAEGTNQA